MEPSAFIRAQGIEKRYRGRTSDIVALQGVDLLIQPQEFVTIVGPSGCGKSITLVWLTILFTAGAEPASDRGPARSDSLKERLRLLKLHPRRFPTQSAGNHKFAQGPLKVVSA